MLTKIVTTTKLRLYIKKIDDESTTLSGNVNQTPSERIESIMELDLVPRHLVL